MRASRVVPPALGDRADRRRALRRLPRRRAPARLRGDAGLPREDDAILGFFNLSQIVARPLQSAYLGYAVGKPFAGQGYMREGIELVLRHAFVTLRLHRVEANIQPGNHASIALARGAGFRREGFSPRYLKIGGRWRDHERWAILAEDWRRPTARRADAADERRRTRPPHRLATPAADVAQLVEHFTRNEGVPGSSPGVGSCELAGNWLVSSVAYRQF